MSIPKPALILYFYLVHLLVPLLLAADVLWAWRFTLLSMSDRTVLALSLLWLIAALGLIIGRERRLRTITACPKLLLSVYAVYFGLAGMELAVRLARPYLFRPTPGVFRPGRWLGRTDPEVMPGLHGTKRFTVNELGLRGPSYPTDGKTYRIITIGGSTTQCFYLDDTEEWPHLLMEELGAQSKIPVWVNNAGISGHTAVQHLAVLQNIPSVQKADAYIFLLGINDLQVTLRFNGTSTQRFLEKETAEFLKGLRKTSTRHPYYKQAVLWQLLRDTVKQPVRDDPGPSRYKFERGLRQMRPVLPLPDLSTGIGEYRQRLLRLGDECARRHARCIFLTQPTIYRPGLSAKELGLLWFGWIGRQKDAPEAFLSLEDMKLAMDQYNAALLEVCVERGLECYDLAAVIPKDTSAFFDDCHFNENGARLVARYLADQLRKHPP